MRSDTRYGQNFFFPVTIHFALGQFNTEPKTFIHTLKSDSHPVTIYPVYLGASGADHTTKHKENSEQECPLRHII